MENKKVTVQGFVLLDLDNVALNNLGRDVTSTFENAVAVKKLVKNGQTYPYISGQAWRYWWRETLALNYGWQVSPIIREKKVAYTGANPILYPDDDLFGYMRAEKGQDTGALTRMSPLKNSALMAVAPTRPINEWSVMARGQDDPVPYEKQVYACVMKGMFSIDLDEVGTFYTQNRSGFRNIGDDLVTAAQQAGAQKIDDPIAKDKNGSFLPRYRLAKDIRLKRASNVIEALHTIAGGAKRATNLSDVTPKLIVMAAQRGGNHPFSHLAIADGPEATFSIDAFRDVLKDYKDNFLGKIYVGRRVGFMDHLSGPLESLSEENGQIVLDNVGGTISSFVNTVLPEVLPT